jgi:hypothetical protein
VKEDGHVIRIVGSVEFGDVEQTLAIEAVIEVTSVESWSSTDIQLPRLSIQANSLDRDNLAGAS